MLDGDLLWKAVTTRDPHWDGLFVYGVSSTGVYCRPTCPSRRASRSRVRFFARPDEAAAAGFRSCRRCHPDSAQRLDAGLERVRAACALIAQRRGTDLSLKLLAERTGVGQRQLLRTFQHALGVSPREYADACRHGCLKSALRAGNGVAAAGYAAGFGSGSRVYERADAVLGMTPARYASGAKGETVKYATARCSLGHLLVAATARGICAVTIGPDPGRLAADLRAEYPGAAIARGDHTLSQATEAIVNSVEGNAPDPRLPLDLRATAFQTRVWRELQRIPRGETRTYQEVARRMGSASASRAVARACAANPVALLVPCHRVVRSDGSTGGYRWGADRKIALLQREK